MKIKHLKPKGHRIFKSTHKVRPLWIQPVVDVLNFSYKTGEWVTYDEYKGGGLSSAYYAMEHKGSGFKDVWSLKAAIRKIKKWNVPKGTKFIVSFPWIGYEAIITKV